MRVSMPRVSVGSHALRNLPLLDITEADFDSVVRSRAPNGVDERSACALMTMKAIGLGHRHWDAWTLIDVLGALGWTESEMRRKTELIEPPF